MRSWRRRQNVRNFCHFHERLRSHGGKWTFHVVGWCPARVHRLDTTFACPQVTTRRAMWPTVALRTVVCSYVSIMIHDGSGQGQYAAPPIPMSPREWISRVPFPSVTPLGQPAAYLRHGRIRRRRPPRRRSDDWTARCRADAPFFYAANSAKVNRKGHLGPWVRCFRSTVLLVRNQFMPVIDANTKVCAVFGHPVGHSLSPAMHNAAFEELGLPYVYVAHDVAPGCIARALDGVRVMGYRGLSVTIPHKVEAMGGVDRVDLVAQGIGCINTVVNQDGELIGYNSDGLGAINALRDAGVDPRDKQVLMLGSGGAARAIAMTLVCEAPPARLCVLGVQLDELDLLLADAQRHGASIVDGGELSDRSLADEIAAADVLLHCSPIGMHPHEGASLVPPERLRPELAVFDAVYNPRRTKLLQDAAAAGCRTIEGIEMFLGQAYVQFELWTGHPAPRQVMRQIVEAKL